MTKKAKMFLRLHSVQLSKRRVFPPVGMGGWVCMGGVTDIVFVINAKMLRKFKARNNLKTEGQKKKYPKCNLTLFAQLN